MGPTGLFHGRWNTLPQSNTNQAVTHPPQQKEPNQAEIHRFFDQDLPDPGRLRKSAELALLGTNLTPEAQEARTSLKEGIGCFKSLAHYCNTVHDILEEQRGKLDHAALYELAVKAVAHIDKIGQNLVDVIMPKNVREWRVFAEEMAVHFLNLPLDLAKHRKQV